MLLTIKRRKENWIGHILHRNCLLKHVIGGKIEGRVKVTRRQGRRRTQKLDDLNEARGYWELKEEALDCTLENSLWKRMMTDCGMNGEVKF
jgi:hypothetical protein